MADLLPKSPLPHAGQSTTRDDRGRGSTLRPAPALELPDAVAEARLWQGDMRRRSWAVVGGAIVIYGQYAINSLSKAAAVRSRGFSPAVATAEFRFSRDLESPVTIAIRPIVFC